MPRMTREERIEALREREARLRELHRETNEFILSAADGEAKARREIAQHLENVKRLNEYIESLPIKLCEAKAKLENQKRAINEVENQLRTLNMRKRLVSRRSRLQQEIRELQRELAAEEGGE